MNKVLIALACAATIPAAGQKFTVGPPTMVAPEGAREGPSWNPFTQTLYMVSGGNVNRYQPGGQPGSAKVEPFRTDAPGANGSLIDPEGRVVVCEAGGQRVTRTEKDGTLTVLADQFEGKRLNSPNDLTLDAKGRIYFTDPRYGNRDNMELREEAVYRIDAPGKVVRVLGSPELERPNGIQISPDGQHLYVADNNNNKEGGARKLYIFNLRANGSVDAASRKLIFDWKNARGPDGLKTDRRGNLFVAAGLNQPSRYESTSEFRGGIFILSPEGRFLEFVAIPRDEVTNCAFGDRDLKTLYITAGDQLWKVRTKTPGRISALK